MNEGLLEGGGVFFTLFTLFQVAAAVRSAGVHASCVKRRKCTQKTWHKNHLARIT